MHEASRRILSVLLQKVEGFSSAKKTTVVCATNRKQDLDSALISRFDLCIRYDLPDEATRKAVFGRCVKLPRWSLVLTTLWLSTESDNALDAVAFRYAKQLSSDELAQLAVLSSGLSCRDIKEVRCVCEGLRTVRLADSGACCMRSFCTTDL